MGNGQSMEKNLFDLRFAAKSLEREAKKCEKDQTKEKENVRKAIQKGNQEGARIYAENAIRAKTQALNYRRMSSRVDAVSQRVQTAVSMNQVTKSMKGVVGNMENAMKSMNLEQMSSLMDNFEKQFENLDVQATYMDAAMGNTVTTGTPQSEVDQLMSQAADEAGIELNYNLPSAQVTVPASSTAEQDELTQRLAKLREI
ncbi:hypothetical protein SNEBB_009671 [Seison nebaliae]|nr:hypothetical protein SNEBB_009671 [Seison nebaliae]